MTKEEKIRELEEKLKKYQEKLAKRSLAYGETGRTGSGDSFSDQLRDDTNVLKGVIDSIKEEIKNLNK